MLTFIIIVFFIFIISLGYDMYNDIFNGIINHNKLTSSSGKLLILLVLIYFIIDRL